jgi:hypothetical protein
MKALQIEPDYAASVAHVFKDMVCRYIQRFENLDLFRLCDLPSLQEGFKSFVPHFGVPKSDSRIFSVFAHAGSRQSFTSAEDDNIILKGRIVATVQTVSDFRKPILRHTGDENNAMDIIETYRRWEPDNLMTSTTYPSGGTLLDAFVLLLSNGFCKETYRLGHLPTLQQSRESFLAAIYSCGDAELSRSAEHKAYNDELMSDRRSELFFQTMEGYIGVSPTRFEIGDRIAVLPGLSVAIALRPVVNSLDTFQIVGPCYLQGVMHGEGVLGPLPEGWSSERHNNRKWCFRRGDSEAVTWEDPRLWPLPVPWVTHSCDIKDDDGPCDGTCETNNGNVGQLTERWFYNVYSKERSVDDPRLDVQGLEAGGIPLKTLTIV